METPVGALSSTMIVVGFWPLIGFLVTLLLSFFGCVRWFALVLARQFEKRIEERLRLLDARAGTLESQLMQLRVELPIEYVRREDWIRFSATIDRKLDLLRNAAEARTALEDVVKRLAANLSKG